MAAYANQDDVLALFRTPPKSDGAQERLATLLEVATDEVINECGGRDYFRHPTSGTETWRVDSDGGQLLHFHEGLISVDLLEYTLDRAATWTAFDTGDYELRGARYDSTETQAGQPYFHLALVPTSATVRTAFPTGRSTLRITGARGWPTVPQALREATAQRARQLAYADATYSGSVPGQDPYNPVDYAQELVATRWPQVLWNFLRADRLRFLACSL